MFTQGTAARLALSLFLMIAATHQAVADARAVQTPVDQSAAAPPQRMMARDTLSPMADEEARTRDLLSILAWEPADFEVTIRRGLRNVGSRYPTDADAVLTFASPVPRGQDLSLPVNQVVLEWYQARRPDGSIETEPAPSVLLLHILDGRMLLERGIARGYAKRGIHTFIMHMPSFGGRSFDRSRLEGTVFFELSRQAVADARRARDAIAALPGVDRDRINIQGLSLGGFIAACAAGIDAAFDQTFVLFAGGQLYDMFTHGQREAQWIRQRMFAAGMTDEQLRRLCQTLEPTLLAHRLVPDRTWMFSAMADQVVPRASAEALAVAARLPETHHTLLPGDHYTVLLHLPWLIEQVAGRIRP
jgi:dienelactone hydrolase